MRDTDIKHLSVGFSSIEELSQALDGLGWESDLLRLDNSEGESVLRARATSRCMLSRFEFSSRIHQRAVPLKGFDTFSLLGDSKAPASFSGQHMDHQALAFMDGQNGLDAISEVEFSGYTIALRREWLEELAEQHGLAAPGDSAWRWQPGQILANNPGAEPLRNSMGQCFTPAFAAGTSRSNREFIEYDLPLMILRAGSANFKPGVSNINARTRVRHRALAYLRSRHRRAVTVHELCEATACSISTLERAFRDEFGVSPKQYMLRDRLSGARRALMDEPLERSITNVAGDWDFGHMGKFARDYRRAFGELPSETRRIHRHRAF